MNTPFGDLKATEISPETQKKFFAKPQHVDKLISTRAAFIVGERGSGKTTILKYLENEFNNTELNYIGVYFRFETAYMKSLFNQDLDTGKNEQGFSQALSLILGKKICETLTSIRNQRRLYLSYEKQICNSVYHLFDETNHETPNSFEELKDYFELSRIKLMKGIREGEVPFLFSSSELLKEFALSLRNEDCFKDICICVLLDEYENLTLTQQRVVNSLVKDSSYYLTYKICLRPEGFRTKLTLADKEQLIEPHDYEMFDYIHDIMGSESEIKKMMQGMCTQRLQYYYTNNSIAYEKEDLNIEKYLEVIGKKDEILSIPELGEFRKEIISDIKTLTTFVIDDEMFEVITDIVDLYLLSVLVRKKYKFSEAYYEILAKGDKYRGWKHNYEQNIIYIILERFERTKIFCGFDTIIKLSHNNARLVLRILHYAFGENEFALDNRTYKKISSQRQTNAIKKVSEKFFEEIRYIPVNGVRIANLTNALGHLFRDILLDKQIKKFEVNHFSIKVSNKLSIEDTTMIANTLKDAVMWGILISERTNKSKTPGDITYNNRDYILNPILAPYFEISYRKKQKHEIKDDVILKMFYPVADSQIKSLSKEIKGKDQPCEQLSFLEI